MRVKQAVGQDPWVTFPTLPIVYFAGEPKQEVAKAPTASINLGDSQDPAELEAFLKRLPR